jgi:hypothetical protein
MIPQRFSAILFLLGASLTIAAIQPPSQPTVLPPEQAAKEGKALVEEILSQKPAQNTTNTGVMTIRRNGTHTRIPIEFIVEIGTTNWTSTYNATLTNRFESVSVLHTSNLPNFYLNGSWATTGGIPIIAPLPGPVQKDAIWKPFAGSDFSLADLGLEFFHWPEQRLTKKEMRRNRSCKVLESINPHPVAGTYSRVVSWIDSESDGILIADAYDSQGKLLKEFIPKKIKKIEGQWQLEEMEIDNDQTHSSTRVDFDLKAP